MPLLEDVDADEDVEDEEDLPLLFPPPTGAESNFLRDGSLRTSPIPCK